MSDNLIITPIETAEERREFVEFQWEVYKDDPYWAPSLVSEREDFIDPDVNPFHEHAKVRYFVARRDGRIVGRIAGLINERHNEYWDEKVGFFGLYEVLEDREASDALLAAAEDFVRSEGMTAIRGPMSFSTNEECGLLVDGWNGPPVLLTTYNPRYYADFIAGQGYAKAQDLYAYCADLSQYTPDGAGVNPKVMRVVERIRERNNIKIQPFDTRNFDAEAERFKRVYNAAWSKNWGFVPLTDDELDYEIKQLRPFVDFDVVFFAEKDGETIGAMLPLPDINQLLLRAYPRPGEPEWWSMLKLVYWWKIRKSITTIRGFAGGVIEEYRGIGVDALLFWETLCAGLRQGYKWMEISWVLESNRPMRQTAANFNAEHYRTYRVYEKGL